MGQVFLPTFLLFADREMSSPASHCLKTVAVIVVFFPDKRLLLRLVHALQAQVKNIVIVDNSAPATVFEGLQWEKDDRIVWLSLGANRGVAAAQNVGVAWARDQGATHVVLFDQDSEPAPDMVTRLLAAAKAENEKGFKIAAVGPCYLDQRQNNPPPFIRVEKLRLKRCVCDTQDAVVPVDYLISSGCLIPMATLDAVGGMVDELFIDYVDIEWGLRARRAGFQSFGVCNAFMHHSLGETPIRFFGRNLPLHTPLRHYYHFRNAVWLYRQEWVPRNWKWVDGYRLLLKYGFYSLFARPRFSHLRMMTLGAWHGLRGRMGCLEEA